MLDVVSATLVTDVLPLGETICAVVIEYAAQIDGSKLAPEYFSVTVKVKDKYVPRTIKRVFANSTGGTIFSAFINRGKFVILELELKYPYSYTYEYDPNTSLSRLLESTTRSLNWFRL